MRILVTGIGARCGTSAMMRTLLSDGMTPSPAAEKFPSYCAPSKNPEGFWDLSPETIQSTEAIRLEENEIVKVFSYFYYQVDWSTVDLMVVMYRNDREAQITSMHETALAEGFEATPAMVDRMLRDPHDLLDHIPSPTIYIEIEELRSNPELVLSKIKEADTWVQQ